MKQFHAMDCQLFRQVNQYFNYKNLNRFFGTITHLGGATFTISTILILILFTSDAIQLTAIASAIALVISHLPVAIIKKLYPRKRPYLVLEEIHVTDKPLKDYSFPSGHTTAIFATLVPFMILMPGSAYVLIPIGILVGISRMYLGLHFPTDVFAGILLGSFTGILSFLIMERFLPYEIL